MRAESRPASKAARSAIQTVYVCPSARRLWNVPPYPSTAAWSDASPTVANEEIVSLGASWSQTSVESSAGRVPRLTPTAATRPPTHWISGVKLCVTWSRSSARCPS